MKREIKPNLYQLHLQQTIYTLYTSTPPHQHTMQQKISDINDEELREHLIKEENKYQMQIAFCEKIYKMVGEDSIITKWYERRFLEMLEMFNWHAW